MYRLSQSATSSSANSSSVRPAFASPTASTLVDIPSSTDPKGLDAPASSLLGLPTDSNSTAFAAALSSFGSGVNPSCSIPRMAATGGADRSLGNIANIVVCGLSVLIAIGLAFAAGRRAAAVGRVEMRVLFLVYALVQGAQLADTGALLRAGSLALTW